MEFPFLGTGAVLWSFHSSGIVHFCRHIASRLGSSSEVEHLF